MLTPGFCVMYDPYLLWRAASHRTTLQIAVAKFLGVQTLRLADAIVLPINTTNYAVQLGKYLDGYVFVARLTTNLLLMHTVVLSDSLNARR